MTNTYSRQPHRDATSAGHDRSPRLCVWVAILVASLAAVALFRNPVRSSWAWATGHLPDCVAEWLANRHVEFAARECAAQTQRGNDLREELRKVDAELVSRGITLREYRSALQGLDPAAQTVRVGQAPWQRAVLEDEIARLNRTIQRNESLRNQVAANLAEVVAGAADTEERVQQLRVWRAELARQADARSRGDNAVNRAEMFFKGAGHP